MMRVMKPDILAEGLALEVNKPKTQGKKIITQIEDQDIEPSVHNPKKQKLISDSTPKIPSKTFKEPTTVPVSNQSKFAQF